jgi:putative Ca2+/H+ antiporter (TMEM165/GDT1 family)
VAFADVMAAFALVFLAELGDKTQLTVALLATRGRPWHVVAGAIAAFLLLTVLACTLGAALTAIVPFRWLRAAAGLLFLAMAFLALRSGDEEEPASVKASFTGAFMAIAVAEMGDKTQIATATLAASRNPFAVGVGAFAALSLSALLAGFLGARFLSRLPRRMLRYGTAIAFAAAGIFFLAQAYLG